MSDFKVKMANLTSNILFYLIVLIIFITDIEGSHYYFYRTRLYYYRSYHRSSFNSTSRYTTKYKGWYAGAAIGVIVGCFLFLTFISVCMKFCIQRINRKRLLIKPSTQGSSGGNNTGQTPVVQSVSQMSNIRRPFNLHRQLQENSSNRHFQLSSSNRYINRQLQRQTTPEDMFSIQRNLPDYREVCSPPPEYSAIDHHQNEDYSTIPGIASPPPSYREAVEQSSTNR